MVYTLEEAKKLATPFRLVDEKVIGGYREFLTHFLHEGEFLYATNSHMAIKIPVNKHTPEPVIIGAKGKDLSFPSLEHFFHVSDHHYSLIMEDIPTWITAHKLATLFKAKRPSKVTLNIQQKTLLAHLFQDQMVSGPISFAHRDLPLLIEPIDPPSLQYTGVYMLEILNTLQSIQATSAHLSYNADNTPIFIEANNISFVLMPVVETAKVKEKANGS